MVILPASRLWLDGASVFILKVFAFGLMIGDHVDLALFGGDLGFHHGVGRAVFPIFGLVLALNLARARNVGDLLPRVPVRMAVTGLVAFVPYAYLFWSWPLNIMFTLALSVVLVGLIDKGWHLIALAVFVLGGVAVDYGHYGLAYVVGAALLLRQGWHVGAVVLLGVLLLWPVNGNWWAAFALPFVVLARSLVGPAPRFKWLFYGGYPAHLAVLAGVKWWLA